MVQTFPVKNSSYRYWNLWNWILVWRVISAKIKSHLGGKILCPNLLCNSTVKLGVQICNYALDGENVCPNY